jgi:hypothetical protein
MRNFTESVQNKDRTSYGVFYSSVGGIKKGNNLHQSGLLIIYQKVREIALCYSSDLVKLNHIQVSEFSKMKHVL